MRIDRCWRIPNTEFEVCELSTDFIFIQDNDPKHTALNTRLWLLFGCISKVLNTFPQSLSVNPVEHLRDKLDMKTRRRI